MKLESRVSNKVIVNWGNFVREVYAVYITKHPLTIGGADHIVEIDESAFMQRKQLVGCVVKTQWVFGGIDTQTQENFLVAVKKLRRCYFVAGPATVCSPWNNRDFRLREGL